MFKKILIVYSEKLSDKHKKTVDRVREIFPGAEVHRADKLSEEIFRDVDLVITIGGDGSFIRAAAFLKDQLILGINSEPETSEGVLLSLMENELDKLQEIVSGKYRVDEMERIKVRLNGNLLKEEAINDVYVGSANQFHTSRYVIRFREIDEEHRSSGVLVTTSVGSTAWYKSAGGCPFKEKNKLKVLVREPYRGNVFKPRLVGGELGVGERIELEGRRHGGGILALDSNSLYPFNFGDVAEIGLSESPLKVVFPQ